MSTLLSLDSQKHISQIIDKLYVGSFWATKKCILKTLNIKHVISIGADPVVHSKKVSYMYVDLADNTQSSNKLLYGTLPTILPFINEQVLENNSVLIHCSAGKSRSISIVAGYLIKYHNMTTKQALDYISERRPCIYPNYGFVEALKQFEKLCN